MLTDGKQWIHEASPSCAICGILVKIIPKTDILPFHCASLHKDTLNMFRVCAMGGYEGEYQKIAPLTIEQFHNILQFSVECIKQINRLLVSILKRYWMIYPPP